MDKILFLNDKGEVEINSKVLQELNKVREEKANAEKRYKELTGAIITEIQKEFGSSLNKVGDYNVVRKGGAYTIVFDEEKFKSENPIDYAKYCKLVLDKESISLTYGKKEK